MYEKSFHDIPRNIRWYSLIAPVLDKLNSYNVPYAIIKGEVLSIQAYGSVGMRHYGDIDVLVSPENLRKTEAAFAETGFRQVIIDASGNQREMTRFEKIMYKNSHQIIPYTKNDLDVDINYDLFWGEYDGVRIDVNAVLRNKDELNVYGHKICVLNDLYSFVALCLHHYREMNAIYLMKYENPFTFSKFQDVYYFFKRSVSKESNKLLDLCSKYRIENYLYYVLYYTNYLFNDDELGHVIDQLRVSSNSCVLETYGLTVSEMKTWKSSFEDRLDKEEIFSLIEPDLTEADLAKIELCWQGF